MENEKAFLRHTVATVAYRAGKVLRDAPSDFATLKAGESSRTPIEILAHMGDLYDWALHLARGEHVWNEADPSNWDEQVERFFAVLRDFDAYLASDAPLGFEAGRLFQGPIADSISHTGQLAMLRRLAGAPVRGENYFKADIAAGRVGADQSTPRREFD